MTKEKTAKDFAFRCLCFQIPSNSKTSPIPPRNNRSVTAAAMNRKSKKFQYLTNKFGRAIKGMEAELQFDDRNKT